MVDSRVAGTAFSIDPVTAEPDSVLIESCLGLGETLVLGREVPSTCVVRKDALTISERRQGSQKTGLRRARRGGGNEAFEVTDANAIVNILSDDEAKEIAAAVVRIESAFGFPVDVEWALEDSRLFILQSRPITAIAGR
jgi:pyruvate,water dikinase